MANGHGGSRTPAKPAPVSGPGAHSKRTDGGPGQAIRDLPDAAYGEAATFRSDQQGAALASAPSPQVQPQANPLAGVVPLGAPTQQPGVPVTDGADAGLGAGSSALGLPMDPEKQDAQHFARYLPVLLDIANNQNTSPGTKAFVRQVFANS